MDSMVEITASSTDQEEVTSSTLSTDHELTTSIVDPTTSSTDASVE
jgi:hypothetical protein